MPGGGLAAAVPQPGVGEGGNAPDRFQVQLLQDPPPGAAPPDQGFHHLLVHLPAEGGTVELLRPAADGL